MTNDIFCIGLTRTELKTLRVLHPTTFPILVIDLHKRIDRNRKLAVKLLRELVKAIYIEAPDKSSGKRHQGIRISYDLVGFIPVEELLKQETA